MKKITVKHIGFVAAVLTLGSTLAMAQPADSQPFAQRTAEQSMTGTVTCTGRITHRYSCQRNQTQQTCTLACVNQGSEFVLKVQDVPYVLEGGSRQIEKYAGGKATVTGVVTGDRIQVRAVSNANQTEADAHAGAQEILRADGSR